ncbi:peptide chain release factor N(5)-glutamine methyltransferase [Acetobacterium bakii]|uniref:Release factor glutamine methyltransferase n=1 Tax=Acetobacterium bakii TaxID=52689 RepID=A0A0L6U716_9FIRM|nr:peptide chain release factor N(5)-glutamine methyltransferase [Acetobacterium bakii]KNZ43590.1 hypothetical protein AKG39_00050 [Acetobacterium bakii]
MDVKEILDFGTTILKKAGVENPRLEAEILLSYILDCDRVYFYAHPQEKVDQLQKEAYLKGLVRRCENEPMAYIFGKKEFMGMSFEVSPDVLIPRPDTEPMVEYLIQRLTNDYPKGAKIFDLCTGSGAIGIALKKFYPQGEIALGDISTEALRVAGANAKQLVKGAVTLYQGDLFAALPKDEKFDVIVSNPPYIKRMDMQALAPDILNYEPHLALDGGSSGLDFYERIIAEARDYLKTPGILALEIGDDQEVSVIDLLVKHGYANIEKHYDLGSHVRCLVGEHIEKKS